MTLPKQHCSCSHTLGIHVLVTVDMDMLKWLKDQEQTQRSIMRTLLAIHPETVFNFFCTWASLDLIIWTSEAEFKTSIAAMVL